MVAGLSLLKLALLPALAADLAAAAAGFGGKVSVREVGARNTLEWRVWLEKNGETISFWHDIPLYPRTNDNSIIRYYVEIPRWTDGKIETKRDEPMNPIFHDEKNDAPRFVESVWPHKTYPFHYGSIPQTWESPNFKHEFTGLIGDNDPMDIFDISELPATVGEIKEVKVLGGLPLEDDGATDWKVLAIDVEDPLAKLVDSVEDLEKYRPGMAAAFYDWFLYYKVVRGSGLNKITGGKWVGARDMRKLVKESHKYWQDLARGRVDSNEINYNQTSDKSWRQSFVKAKDTTDKFGIPKEASVLPAAARPAAYDKWYYLDKDFNLIKL